jgi:HSP20 family molecular chaperone IbpA
MRNTRLDLMFDHVRAIHRALTGEDPPVRDAPSRDVVIVTPEQVLARFADLDQMARAIPSIAERVPPFAFTPLLDVIGTERELIFELGVPGIDTGDVDVAVSDGWLTVAGARSGAPADDRIYLHVEMPRGPFRREVQLRVPTSGAPRVEVDKGIVRVRIAKAAKSALPRA